LLQVARRHGLLPTITVATDSAQVKLSEREMDVLRLIAQGKSAREAADKLPASKRVINFHLNNIYRKLLGVSSRPQEARRIRAITEATRLGLIP